MNKPEARLYAFGEFRFDAVKECLFSQNPPVPQRLQPKDCEVLLLLIKKRGNIVTRQELLEEVWNGDKDEDPALNSAVHRLRKALDDRGNVSKYIQTTSKQGYRFIAPVSEVDGDEAVIPSLPAQDPPKSESLASDDPPPRINWEYGWGFIAALISLIIVVVILLMIGRPIGEFVTIVLQFAVILCTFAALALRQGPERFGASTPESRDAEAQVRRDSGYEDEPSWEKAKAVAQIALEDYKKDWHRLLLVWTFLYIVLAFLPPESGTEQTPPHLTKWKLVLRFLAILFNNCNSLVLALGYRILSKSTVRPVKAGAEATGKSGYESSIDWPRSLLLLVIITLSITGIEAGVVLLANEAWSPLNLFLVLLTYKAGPPPNLFKASYWLSGIGGSITLGLYVGRLQSEFLDWIKYSADDESGQEQSSRIAGPLPHSLYFVLLYGYVAIQPLFPLIEMIKDPYRWVAPIITGAAMCFKGVLCYYVFRLLYSGRLLFYFVRVRRTNEKVDKEWRRFKSLLESNPTV